MKTRLKLLIRNHPFLFRIFRFVYSLIKKTVNLQHNVSYGNLNSDKTIYLIRPNTDDGIQGLMSLMAQVMRRIDYAVNKGYIPYIDFKTYKTQYYDGINNIWEVYFGQPSSLSFEEVYNSNRLIVSGVSLKCNENMELFQEKVFTNKHVADRCFNLITRYVHYSAEIVEMVEDENKKIDISNCIGVYVRGTDYVKLKPVGEYVQPKIDDVLIKTKEFLSKYNSNVFLVTEDEHVYNKFRESFGNELRIVSFDSFIKDYDGKSFLSKSNVLQENKYMRGRDYLIKIILLSQCRYLVTSKTMGSIMAYSMNGGKYEDQFIFELGIYK